MTHAVRKLYTKIEDSDCPVASFDMATDILFNVGNHYTIHHKKAFRTRYIKDICVGYNPVGEFLNIYVTCDDCWTYGTTLTMDEIKSYKEEIE